MAHKIRRRAKRDGFDQRGFGSSRTLNDAPAKVGGLIFVVLIGVMFWSVLIWCGRACLDASH